MLLYHFVANFCILYFDARKEKISLVTTTTIVDFISLQVLSMLKNLTTLSATTNVNIAEILCYKYF